MPRAFVSGQPSIGSTNFNLTIDQGVGGALSGMFLSAKPADFPFLNLRLLVDLNPAYSMGPILKLLGGSGGVAGAGSPSCLSVPPFVFS